MVGLSAAELIETVGPDLVTVRLNVVAAVLPFVAASWATFAAMAALTRPSAAGTRLKVYVVPEPAKPEIVALVGLMSATVKPLTGSSNVTVTGIVEAFVGSGIADVRTDPGPGPVGRPAEAGRRGVAVAGRSAATFAATRDGHEAVGRPG